MKTYRLVAIVVAILAAAPAALFLAPGAPALGDPDGDTGDAELARRVRGLVPDADGFRGLAVATVEVGRVRFAGLGDAGGGRPVTEGTPFENGSVTKVYTAMLFADMVSRGEVKPTDTLGDLLPGRAFADPAVASVTLEELASHRSGLPRLAPEGLGGVVNSLWSNLSGGDPYRETDAAAVLDVAGRVDAGDGRGEVHYSNFGMSVLGQALAVRAGTPYPDLVRERLFTPVGMTATGFRPDGAPVPAGAAAGGRASGRPVDPWSDPSYAPAGIGDWTTASDLATLLTATMAGSAPGADASRPRFTENDTRRIGYGWYTTRYGDREITWHNGGTAGFKSYVGFDRAAGRGVVVLGNTDRDVDPVGVALLGGRWWPAPDRLRLVNGVVSAAAGLALAHALGAWTALPGLLWTVGFGLTAAALAVTALRWRSLPTVRGGQRGLRFGSAAVSLVVSLVAIGAVTVAAAG